MLEKVTYEFHLSDTEISFLFYCNYDNKDHHVPSLFCYELLQNSETVMMLKKEWQHQYSVQQQRDTNKQ